MRWAVSAGMMVLVVTTTGWAEDWPQLLGPQRNNTTSETIAVWKEAPREVWRRRVGDGNSFVVVSGGTVFVHGKVEDREEEEVVALDAVTGEPRWRTAYARRPFSSTNGNGPRAVPTVSLGRVYTHGVTGILSSLDAKTGRLLWQVDVHKKFQVKPPKYGVTSSPVVEGNRVLVHVGGPDACVAAFDADTGEVAWKALADPISTSSPIVIPGQPRQVVFQTGVRIVSLDATDGKLLWDHPLADASLDSMGALLWTGEILLSSSVHFGGLGLEITRQADRFAAKELWLNPKLGSYYHSAVPLGSDHYVLLTNTPMPGAHLCCVEAKTGKVKWTEENVADWHAGLIRLGDGKLLLCDGKGVLRLIDATPERYRELARAEVGLTSSSNPVLANGRLYLRDRKQDLICVEFRK